MPPLHLDGTAASISLRHKSLYRDRALDRSHDRGEFKQHTVAGGFDDASAVFGDNRRYRFAVRAQTARGARFVSAHEAAVAGHVGGENGCESALDPLRRRGPASLKGSIPSSAYHSFGSVPSRVRGDGRTISVLLGGLMPPGLDAHGN